MEFKHQEIKDWILENHKRYWESDFPVDRLCRDKRWNPILRLKENRYLNVVDTEKNVEGEGKWAYIISIGRKPKIRILYLDLDNDIDFYDYPIEDYKIWLRDVKINEILK